MKHLWQYTETTRENAKDVLAVVHVLAGRIAPDGYEPVKDERGGWKPFQVTKSAVCWERLLVRRRESSLT